MKTLHRVRERFFWGKVRADVEQWCKSCDACSARKGPKICRRGKLHRYNVGAPFEHIAFDILGPLPRTASGNKYLLVVMDYFTKWPEVYPIPDQEAPTVAEAVVQHWISRYGVPLQLHSDQGRNFVSAVLKGVCELHGIDKTKTTPLHPQSDGMVERFNRTILNNLSLMVSKNQKDWDQKVPLFLLAYRSAVHETTGYSPSQMLFGRDLRLPCDLLFGHPPDTPSSPEEYVQNLQARFEDVHNLAREQINLRDGEDEDLYWLYFIQVGNFSYPLAANIQELSSYLSQSTPSSPYHLSKSQSSLITTSSTSELEKVTKVNTVSVPKIDDESFTSFFKSVKDRISRISVSSFDISDEVFEYLSSETHEL
ncbi:retrovirus-related Pol polyprotein from transposon 412 [Trichonephila clavipes]|nr:retrovirus-related Pol polyprotein from transposon 412 [Trichonephila clavipes]